MKKLRNILGVAAAFLLICLAVIHINRRKEDPEVLLSWLKKGKGDRQENIMRLNMARGDVAAHMIRHFNDSTADPGFRADVVELMFKRNLRTPDERLDSACVKAMYDTRTAVRRAAVKGFGTYGDATLQPKLIPFLADPDSAIRRHVYTIFIESEKLWRNLTDTQRTQIVDLTMEHRATEKDSELAFLVRSVIGREIAWLCKKARQAMQRTEYHIADSLFYHAMTLDSTNYRPHLIMANLSMLEGQRDKALKIARQGNVLVEIPRLRSAPKIDGDPTDPVWKQALFRNKAVIGNSYTYEPSTGKVEFYIGHYNGKIYLAVLSYEEDLSKLRITKTKRDEPIWVDDCVEIIFMPTYLRRQFYKFIINAGGTLYDRYSNQIHRNFKCEHAVTIHHDRGYWALEFAVHGRDLDNHPVKSGEVWNFNIYPVRAGVVAEYNSFWYHYWDDIMALVRFK